MKIVTGLMVVACAALPLLARAQNLTIDEETARRMSPGRGAELAGEDAWRRAVLADASWQGWRGLADLSPPVDWIPPVVGQLCQQEIDGVHPQFGFFHGLAFDWDDDGLRELILIGRFFSDDMFHQEWTRETGMPEVWLLMDFPEDPSAQPQRRYFVVSGDVRFDPALGRELRWQDVNRDGAGDLTFGVTASAFGGCFAFADAADYEAITGHVALLSPASTPHLGGLGGELAWNGTAAYGCDTPQAGWLSPLDNGVSLYAAITDGHAPIDGTAAIEQALGLGPFGFRPVPLLPLRPEAVSDPTLLARRTEEGFQYELPTEPEAPIESSETGAPWVAVLGIGSHDEMTELAEGLLPFSVPADEHLLVLIHRVASCCCDMLGASGQQIEYVLTYGWHDDQTAMQAAAQDLMARLPDTHPARQLAPTVALLDDDLILLGAVHATIDPRVIQGLPPCPWSGPGWDQLIPASP